MPTVGPVDVTSDVYIRDTTPTTNYNGSNLIIGKSTGQAQAVRRILIYIDLTAYVGTYISEAHIVLTAFNAEASGAAKVFRITQTALSEGGATWNNYDTGLPWATAGLGLSDYTETGGVDWTTPTPSAPYSLENLGDLFQDAVTNRGGHLHLLLKLVDEVTAGIGVAFRDSEYGSLPEQRPKYYMTYSNDIPALPDVADPDVVYSSADAPYVRLRIAG